MATTLLYSCWGFLIWFQIVLILQIWAFVANNLTPPPLLGCRYPEMSIMSQKVLFSLIHSPGVDFFFIVIKTLPLTLYFLRISQKWSLGFETIFFLLLSFSVPLFFDRLFYYWATRFYLLCWWCLIELIWWGAFSFSFSFFFFPFPFYLLSFLFFILSFFFFLPFFSSYRYHISSICC